MPQVDLNAVRTPVARPPMSSRNPGIVPPWLVPPDRRPGYPAPGRTGAPIPITPDPNTPRILGGAIPISPDPDTPRIFGGSATTLQPAPDQPQTLGLTQAVGGITGLR